MHLNTVRQGWQQKVNFHRLCFSDHLLTQQLRSRCGFSAARDCFRQLCSCVSEARFELVFKQGLLCGGRAYSFANLQVESLLGRAEFESGLVQEALQVC